GRFSLRLGDQYARTIQPFTDATPTGPIPTYVRNRNLFNAQLNLGSRSGALRGSLGYGLGVDAFKDQDYRYFTSLTHHVNAKVRWSFLPQAAIFHRTEVAFQNYYRAGPGASALVSDNVRIHSTLGLNGAITPKIAFTL